MTATPNKPSQNSPREQPRPKPLIQDDGGKKVAENSSNSDTDPTTFGNTDPE